MIPGGYVDNFSTDLVEISGISAIVCATECGAAMMADGFARASGQFGVCLGISGPGASNMITGLSISSADQITGAFSTLEAFNKWGKYYLVKFNEDKDVDKLKLKLSDTKANSAELTFAK